MLRDKKTKELVLVGDIITSFRGEKWQLRGVREPRVKGCNAKVQVEREGSDREYYAGVFNLEWFE